MFLKFFEFIMTETVIFLRTYNCQRLSENFWNALFQDEQMASRLKACLCSEQGKVLPPSCFSSRIRMGFQLTMDEVRMRNRQRNMSTIMLLMISFFCFYRNPPDMTITLATTFIIPVDLNTFMYKVGYIVWLDTCKLKFWSQTS